MQHCAFCKNPLIQLSEWKGTDGRFYCNEFCADASEATELVHRSVPPASLAQDRTPAAPAAG